MHQINTTLLTYLLFFFFILGCDSSHEKKQISKSPRIKSQTKIEAPRNGASYVIGDTIPFQVSTSNEDVKIDSVQVSLNGQVQPTPALIWNTEGQNPGKKQLLLSVFLSNGQVEKKRMTVTLRSDLEPIRYTYRLINTYDHDADAFTQGLFFDEGVLYESTGHKGQSTLRKVEIKSGKILRQTDLSSQYFGEGIALVKDQIFMLSWQEHVGFVFDKNSFEPVRQFTYATEGWGLTSQNDTLILSDGTNLLRFMEPESFSEIRQIEVYDQQGPISELNELECIKGDIFAIRWQTELIYVIESKSGKVKGILDLTGIFDYANYDKRIDVLNGIAYNNTTDTYYITGKWWPKLFEIKLIAANNI